MVEDGVHKVPTLRNLGVIFFIIPLKSHCEIINGILFYKKYPQFSGKCSKPKFAQFAAFLMSHHHVLIFNVMSKIDNPVLPVARQQLL